MFWPRILRLQWSLRTLLVAITLAAGCVAVVTRWPLVISQRRQEFLWREGTLSPLATKEGDVSSTTERATYRGLIPQYRVRHGKSELFAYSRGSLNRLRVVERHYASSVLHGEYREFFTSSQLRTEGEYHFGRKHGKWLNYREQQHFAANNDYLLTERWEQGVPHGPWQWENAYGDVSLTAKYDHGRVAEVNGEPVIDWLHRLARTLPPESLNAEWRRKLQETGNATNIDFRPMVHSTHWLADECIDAENRFRSLDDDVYYPLVDRVPREVRFAHALHVMKLALTVRHNMVFLTTPDRIGPEHDPTGVSQLKIPEGSLLEQSLAAELELDRWNAGQRNGRQVLEFLGKDCRVPLDDSALRGTLEPRDEDRVWIRLADGRTSHRVRDLLGITLFRMRCRCDLVEGQLVITRQ